MNNVLSGYAAIALALLTTITLMDALLRAALGVV